MNDPSAPAPPEVPSPLQVASWEKLGVLPTDKVPLWAAYWIAGGHDGEALIYLAGLHGDDPREVHDALPQALRDCGVEMPDPGTGAAAAAFTDLARLEVNGLAWIHLALARMRQRKRCPRWGLQMWLWTRRSWEMAGGTWQPFPCCG